MHRLLQAALTFSFILIFGLSLQAQTRIETSTAGQGASSSGGTTYRYLFENDRFTTPRQEIEFDETGRGKFSFKKKDGDEIVNKLEVSKELVAQVNSILDELNFLNSTEDYQYKKDFSHLGNVTLTHARSGRERRVTFNYTDNQVMNRLVEIFRNIATQETRVFELQTVRQTDPISTPAQLRILESELKSKHIAEPQRLTPLLQDIRTDESVPLIARNHAERLLKSIQKGK
ncbi:MAG TPA: hypothetical protein VFD58_24255 [Blastocatellia bacterium]|nr:hypothetical protein [Blastocatellia bacterium]